MKVYLQVAIVAAALVLASCGGHRSAGLPIQQTLVNPPSQQVLAQLEAYPCPADVDAQLWEELKSAFRTELTKSTPGSPARLLNSEDEDGHGMPCPYRSVATPPTGEANRVNDLGITDNGDGTFTLSWHYRNLGDYDQDGQVGIEDITPIALHFGEAYDLDTEPNSVQAVIDGSGNGKVDIADVTQIAMYFSVSVHHYAVEGTDDYEQPYVEMAQVALPAHGNIARLEITHDLGVPPYRYWRVVPVDGDGVRGQASNVVSTQPGEPPEILSVSPTEGDSGTEATFTAEVTGDGPLEYHWTFGGGAAPNESSQFSPTVTLSRGGTLPEPTRTYPASLTVTNPYGTDILDFDLSVSAWWHIEEIPKVPGHEEDEIGQALYDYGPDGSLWGIHYYPSKYKYLIHWSEDLFEYEQLPWDHGYNDHIDYLKVDREGRPAVLGREYTGILEWTPFFAIRTELGWEQEEIERTGQLLFDSANRAVMVYGALWVARRTAPGEWEKTRVWEGAAQHSLAAMRDSDGALRIVYASNLDLYLAAEDRGVWQTEKLLEGMDNEVELRNYLPAGLVLDSRGNPLILAREATTRKTVTVDKYATTALVGEANAVNWEWEMLFSKNANSPEFTTWTGGLAILPSEIAAAMVRLGFEDRFMLFISQDGTWGVVQDFLWSLGGVRLTLSPCGDPVVVTSGILYIYK